MSFPPIIYGLPMGAAWPGTSSLPPGTRLLSFSDGYFYRGTEGSYIASNGSVSWSNAGVLRTGDRGTLIERARLEWLNQNVPMITQWSAINGASVTANNVVSPDGNTNAPTVSLSASAVSGYSQTIGTTLPTTGEAICFSGWEKIITGDGLLRPNFQNRSGTIDTFGGNHTIAGSTWARTVYPLSTTGTGAFGTYITFFNTATPSPTAKSFSMWGWQALLGRYPLSVVRSGDVGQTTWQADLLTFLSAQVPLQIRQGKWSTVVTPEWAPSDLVSGDIRVIASFGGSSDVLQARHNGTNVVIEAKVGGSVKATSPNLTGSAKEVARTVVVDCANGIISVNGAAGSTGSAIVWPGGMPLRIGGIFGSTGSEADAYITEPVAA